VPDSPELQEYETPLTGVTDMVADCCPLHIEDGEALTVGVAGFGITFT